MEEEIKKGKEVLDKNGVTTEELKAETDRIAQSSASIFQKFYQQAQQSQQGAGQSDDSQVKYDVHDDDKK